MSPCSRGAARSLTDEHARGCGMLQREALCAFVIRGQLSRLSSQKFTRLEIAPSTTRFEPVVNEEAGLAKNTAAFAISCGVAMRPVGLRASASSYRLGMFCSIVFQTPPLK